MSIGLGRASYRLPRRLWVAFLVLVAVWLIAVPSAAIEVAPGFTYDSSDLVDPATTVPATNHLDRPIRGVVVSEGFVYDPPDYRHATNTARGVRGLAGAGDELAQGGVYALRDPVTGQVVRTGRTNDLIRRAGEHLRDPALADFEFEIIARTDIYAQQRGLEQLIHEAYSPPLNMIQPISPTNPNLTTYLGAADQFLSIYGGG